MHPTKKIKIVKHATKDVEKIKALMMQVEADLEKARETQARLTTIQRSMDEVSNKIDSMSEMGETESLRLQMAMDRFSKMMTTLGNVLKKISDTSSSITQNLK